MDKPPDKSDAADKRGAEKAKPRKKGKDFGLEGTNKTVATPLPEAQPSEQLQGTKNKFVPKTPYTRG